GYRGYWPAPSGSRGWNTGHVPRRARRRRRNSPRWRPTGCRGRVGQPPSVVEHTRLTGSIPDLLVADERLSVGLLRTAEVTRELAQSALLVLNGGFSALVAQPVAELQALIEGGERPRP